MAKNNNLTDFVRDLADGFREKLGWQTTDKINPQDFRDFINNSPSVGTLTTGLETLNWTKTIPNTSFETVECPIIDSSLYFDTVTQKQLLPLIQFTIQALDVVEGDGEVRIYDDMTDATIGHFTATENGDIKYILPVIGNVSTPQKYSYFPSFSISVYGAPVGFRLKMTATWVQIGSTQYPMRLSGATMGGIK